MTEHTPEMTPTLRTAAGVRADLHAALIETEAAISAAAPGRFPEWIEAVEKGLMRLHYAFHAHVDVAEGPNGLYEEVLEREPRLAGEVDRLKKEHPEILASIHDPYHRLRARETDEFIPAEEVRRAVTIALGRISRHRQRGADLVWETYYVELGGMG